jgi:hypothetical protein
VWAKRIWAKLLSWAKKREISEPNNLRIPINLGTVSGKRTPQLEHPTSTDCVFFLNLCTGAYYVLYKKCERIWLILCRGKAAIRQLSCTISSSTPFFGTQRALKWAQQGREGRNRRGLKQHLYKYCDTVPQYTVYIAELDQTSPKIFSCYKRRWTMADRNHDQQPRCV